MKGIDLLIYGSDMGVDASVFQVTIVDAMYCLLKARGMLPPDMRARPWREQKDRGNRAGHTNSSNQRPHPLSPVYTHTAATTMFGDEEGGTGGGEDAVNTINAVATAMFGEETGGDIPYGQTSAPGIDFSEAQLKVGSRSGGVGAGSDAFGDEGSGSFNMYGHEGAGSGGEAHAASSGATVGETGGGFSINSVPAEREMQGGSGTGSPQQQRVVSASAAGNGSVQQQITPSKQQQPQQQPPQQVGQTSPGAHTGRSGSSSGSSSSDDDEAEDEENPYQEENQYQEEGGGGYGGGGGGGYGQGYSEPGYEPCGKMMRLKVWRKVVPPAKPLKRGGGFR